MTQDEQNPTENVPPTPDAPRTEGGSQPPPTAARGASAIDWAALPPEVLRVIRDPGDALGSLHRPGTPALLRGLILGIGSAVLVVLLQSLFLKILMGRWFAPGVGHILEQILGGAIFLAAGAAMSFLLRSAPAGRTKDFTDDAYLVGASMVFLVAGTLVWGIFSLFKTEIFMTVATAGSAMGFLLTGLTYHAGLKQLGETRASKAVWMAGAVFAVALLVGLLLKFSPLGSAMTFVGMGGMDPGAAQEQLKEGLEEMMRGMQR
jgi:hypothetical protein